MTNAIQGALALAPYALLAFALPALIFHEVPAANHDVVLSLVSGVLGAIGGPAAKAGAQKLADTINAPNGDVTTDGGGGR